MNHANVEPSYRCPRNLMPNMNGAANMNNGANPNKK